MVNSLGSSGLQQCRPGQNAGISRQSRLSPSRRIDSKPCLDRATDGFIYWYNQRWFEYTGTTPGEMVGWGWQSAHDPAVLPQVLERWRSSIQNAEPFEMTFPIRGADGVYRPFLTRTVPLKDDNNAVLRWFGTNTEVGEQILATAALRESEERFRTATQAVNGVLWTNDSKGEMQGEQPGWSNFTDRK